jgi:hypothetical protein
VLLARFFWKEKGEAMIHLDAANITPTMIDESIESFANISEDRTAYVLEDAMGRSVLLKLIHRNMPPICRRQSAFNWLQIGLMLGFELAEKASISV